MIKKPLTILKAIADVAITQIASTVPLDKLEQYVPEAIRVIEKVREAVNPGVNKDFKESMTNIGYQMQKATNNRELCFKYQSIIKSNIINMASVEQSMVVLADSLNVLNVGYNLHFYQLCNATLGRNPVVNQDHLVKALDENSVDFQALVAQLSGKFDKLAPVVQKLDMSKFPRLAVPGALGAYIVAAGVNEGFAIQANRILIHSVDNDGAKNMLQAHSLYKEHNKQVDELIAGYIPFSLVGQAYQESLKEQGVAPSDREMAIYFEKVAENAIEGAKKEWGKTGGALKVLGDGKFSEFAHNRTDIILGSYKKEPGTTPTLMKSAVEVVDALRNFLKGGGKS